MLRPAFALAAASLLTFACVPIEPKSQCAQAANDCDQGLDEPTDAFLATDQTFGDLGTCWTNEETAKACVAECDKFVAETLAAAQLAKNNALILACGGEIEGIAAVEE